MSTLEKTIDRIKTEGFSSIDVQKAISKMREESTKETSKTGSLDKYHYSFWDEE
ncbi:hypothetical protein [Neobacillus cucumis]|uniref:hypothetical protein n=1 Tax=Neobacillus cucumis TaxID=1740721 RepID=UPI00285365E9|nr:hypothetical protein [Neobacillus cucumis]MDR4947072.1 hypothetical protein [Neobacillus cucumis]